MDNKENKKPQDNSQNNQQNNGDIDYRDPPKPKKQPKIDKMGLEVTKNPRDVSGAGKKVAMLLLILGSLALLFGSAYVIFTTMNKNMQNNTELDNQVNNVIDENNAHQSTQSPEIYSVFGELLRKYVSF